MVILVNVNNNNNNVFDLYSALSTNVIKGAGVTSKEGISLQEMQVETNEFLGRNKICWKWGTFLNTRAMNSILLGQHKKNFSYHTDLVSF